MSLRARLTLWYALTLALTLIATGAVLYSLLARGLDERLKADLSELARAHALLAVSGPEVSLRRLPTAPRSGIQDLGVRLLDPSGQVLEVLGAGEPFELPAGVLRAALAGTEVAFRPAGARPAAALIDTGVRRGVAYPIVSLDSSPPVAFVLVLTAADAGAARALGNARVAILLCLAGAGLVALLAGRALASRLARPLSEIAATAAAVQDGDLGRRVPGGEGRDEVAALKRSLNLMLGRLETLVAAQRRFTADAAHDLRTPVAVLRAEVEVALRRPRDAAGYRESLERVRQEVLHLARLSEDLLSLSRAEAGADVAREPFGLADALAPALAIYASLAAARGLGFSANVPPGAVVVGDRALVARAVQNLLDNAVAHTAEGAVGIELLERAGRVAVRVWDTGPGVPAGERERLFDRFRKGAGSTGSGLGLAIVREVALAHGGRVTVTDRPGGGSVFELDLPACAGPARLILAQGEPATLGLEARP